VTEGVVVTDLVIVGVTLGDGGGLKDTEIDGVTVGVALGDPGGVLLGVND